MDLSFEQVVSILSQIHSFSPNIELAVAGGEPLMRYDLKDIFYHIKDNLPGMNIELLTNATLINQSNIEWLAETVRGFNISMEGARPEIHDSIRGKGAFQKTVRALKLLIENNAEVAVRMTYFDQQENEPENLMRFINDIGVKMFNFRYLVPVGRAANKELDANQYRRLCERVWEVGQNLNMIVGFSDPFPEILVNMQRQKEIENDTDLLRGISVTGCSIAFALLYINPQGIVQLCPYLPIFVADAKKDDLKKIWFENDLLERFRSSRSLLKGKCGSCEYKFACGGCRGSADAKDNFLGEEPRCWKR
jgi:radical SAM protein with 4Fe4S-binding SPASM domain